VPTIRLKRAYDDPASDDGVRILVDRLWPRGIKKEDLALDAWAKEVAPSNELRKWFGHDPRRWPEFKKRYRSELKKTQAAETIRKVLVGKKRVRTVTLLYGAKDREHNQAVVLRDFLQRQ
jgi:uncharacterized protein YeaO (DUF488 family)